MGTAPPGSCHHFVAGLGGPLVPGCSDRNGAQQSPCLNRQPQTHGLWYACEPRQADGSAGPHYYGVPPSGTYSTAVTPHPWMGYCPGRSAATTPPAALANFPDNTVSTYQAYAESVAHQQYQAAYDASQQQTSWKNTPYPGGYYFPNATMYGRAPPGAPLWGPARPVDDGFESVPYWAGARCPEYPSTSHAAYWQYQLKQRQYWEYAAMRRHSAPAVTGTPQPAPRNGDLPSASPACGLQSATPAVASMGWQQYFAGTPASQLPFLKHVVAPVSRQGRPENFPVRHGLHCQPPSTSNAVPPWLTKSLQEQTAAVGVKREPCIALDQPQGPVAFGFGCEDPRGGSHADSGANTRFVVSQASRASDAPLPPALDVHSFDPLASWYVQHYGKPRRDSVQTSEEVSSSGKSRKSPPVGKLPAPAKLRLVPAMSFEPVQRESGQHTESVGPREAATVSNLPAPSELLTDWKVGKGAPSSLRWWMDMEQCFGSAITGQREGGRGRGKRRRGVDVRLDTAAGSNMTGRGITLVGSCRETEEGAEKKARREENTTEDIDEPQEGEGEGGGV